MSTKGTSARQPKQTHCTIPIYQPSRRVTSTKTLTLSIHSSKPSHLENPTLYNLYYSLRYHPLKASTLHLLTTSLMLRILAGGAQFINVCPRCLRPGKFSMPSTSLALTSAYLPPSTYTPRSTALLSLFVNPWTPLMPVCCIHSLYISSEISAPPSGLKTETVKLVSILPLNVAPVLMYYLLFWIAILNRSYGKSVTHEGKHKFSLRLSRALDDRR